MNQLLTRLFGSISPFISSILGKPVESNAVKDAARQLTYLIALHEIDFKTFLDDRVAGRIFDPTVLLKGGNLFDFVAPQYRAFANELFSIRSTGLGTPNSASGEGELMALVLSPRVTVSKKKDKGDIAVDGMTVELKGWGVRMFGRTSGKELNRLGHELCAKYGIKPNASTVGRTAVEPWCNDAKKAPFWNQQFLQLGESRSIEFLTELMNGTGAVFSQAEIAACFRGTVLNRAALLKLILKKFFRSTNREWECYTIITNGKVVVLTPNADVFDALVDTGTVVAVESGNYFRMFQDVTVGWYFEVK